jgi:hypothetical protein
MRARIALLRRRRPTLPNLVDEEVDKIRRGQGTPLTIADVWLALSSGREVCHLERGLIVQRLMSSKAPDLITMECQRFDFDFLSKLRMVSSGQNKLAAPANRRKPRVSTNRTKSVSQRNKGEGMKGSTSEGQEDSGDDSDDTDDYDDNDGDWEDVTDSVSGPSAHTRSRAKVNSASNSRMAIHKQVDPPILVISSGSENER